MPKNIITISREFGSGGRFIGEQIADKLGFAYYDKDIINRIAEESGLSPNYIQENSELSPRKGLFAYALSGRDITGKSVEDMLYKAQRNVILEIAKKGSCRNYRKKCRLYFKGQKRCAQCFYIWRYTTENTAYL